MTSDMGDILVAMNHLQEFLAYGVQDKPQWPYVDAQVSMVKDALDELAALRAWRDRAVPLLRALADDYRYFDEDGNCTFCENRRADEHKWDCDIAQARALLAESEASE